MKSIVFAALAGSIVASSAFSQEKTLVGKWKYTSVAMGTMVFDLENYESGKNSITDRAKKEKGRELDSASVDMIYRSMASVFRMATLEFTADGRAIFISIHDDGDTTIQSDHYQVNHPTRTLKITHSIDPKEKPSNTFFRFDGPYLILDVPEKATVFKLRRVR